MKLADHLLQSYLLFADGVRDARKNFFSIIADTIVHHYFFSFYGRMRRSDFWVFFFAYSFLMDVFFFSVSNITEISIFYKEIFVFLYYLITFPIFCGAIVRRLHDMGKSGKWSLLLFLPILGFFLFILLAFPGSEKGMKYGPEQSFRQKKQRKPK